MEKYVFCLRDKKLGAYQNPFYRNDDKEHVIEDYVRSAKLSPASDRARVADLALYFLGAFDDIKGEFVLTEQPEKLLDLEDYVPKKED